MKAKQKRMIAAVKSLQDFMNTYSKQPMYADYSDEGFINDVLYGLGVALNKKDHEWADGFDVFKKKLRAHLGD